MNEEFLFSYFIFFRFKFNDWSIFSVSQLNGKDYVTLRIKRKELNAMSEDEVLNFALQNPKLHKKLQGKEIKNFWLESRKGCGAHLSIRIRNKKVDVPVEI